MSDHLEIGQSQNRNGESHAPSVGNASSIPKHVAGRKQSSSKKFKIESVAVRDDPLYNKDPTDNVGGASRSPLQTRKLSRDETIDKETVPESPSLDIHRTEPEGSGGEALFHSVENLQNQNRKLRTSSNLSGIDQKFYSVDDLTRDTAVPENSQNQATDQVELQEYPTPPSVLPDSTTDTSRGDSQPVPGEDGVAKPVPVTYHTRRMGNSQLKFDDSFIKRATVQARVDSHDNPDPEAVTDIFIPVPSVCPSHENTLHETITSTYETNLSINKLLRERHKGSLAAMGRIFGNKQKQKEVEKAKSSTVLLPTIVKPKKKRKCHCLRPIHVCLTFTLLVIVCATIVTLVMLDLSRERESVLAGYHFDYVTRELFVYPWGGSQHSIASPSFKGIFGVNISPGLPFNCTYEYGSKTADGRSCYKFYNMSTLHLSTEMFGETALCLTVEWRTNVSNPMLEDCIDLSDPDQYGHWFGGHNIKGETFPLGEENVAFSSYLPGKVFGHMAERFWISTKGVAVVAKHDFPLHIRIASGDRLCLSSWYGLEAGNRALSYSVCRDTSPKAVHKIVMENFYHSNIAKLKDLKILSAPVFSSSQDLNDVTNEIVNLVDGLNYSYIIDTRNPINKGFRISPYSVMSNSYPDLSSNMWIQSTDMNVPRLFNIDDKPYTLLNATYGDLSNVLLASSNNASDIILVTDLATGDIHGQEYYPISEIQNVFQPYIRNFISALKSSQALVMSSVVAGLQNTPTIVYLQPESDIGEKVRQILHASLMGYNLINAGEISDTLSDEEFIQMIHLAMFLPVIQFSDTVLSRYNNSLRVIDAWKECILGRKKFRVVESVTDYLKANGTHPLYTAPWWHDTELETVSELTLSNQFIFNNQYMVVPIINTTLSERIVYFPHGLWFRIGISNRMQKFASSKELHRGPKTVAIPVDIHEILVFEYEPKS